jgi:hypothetical protein
MDDEHRVAYALAMEYGAKKTAALIRANKASIGRACIEACKEIGTQRTFEALMSARNGEWSMCAMRYVADITITQRVFLASTLTLSDLAHARWVLANMSFLPESERAILKWILRTKT